jgi:hypothetical protein
MHDVASGRREILLKMLFGVVTHVGYTYPIRARLVLLALYGDFAATPQFSVAESKVSTQPFFFNPATINIISASLLLGNYFSYHIKIIYLSKVLYIYIYIAL